MTLERKTQLLRMAFNGGAIVCIALIVMAAVPTLAKRAAPDREFYGDLYKLNKVEEFKVPIMRRGEPSATTLKEAEIIAIGDSFFDVTYEGPKFATRFEKTTNRKTYNVDYDLTKRVYTEDPHRYFKDHPVDHKTVLLWERVERNLVNDILDARGTVLVAELEQLIPERIRASKGYDTYERYRDILFHTEPLVFLLQNSVVTHRAYETLNTFRFRVTGDLSPLTPEYVRDPLMLYYGPALKTTRAELLDAEIQKLAETIAEEYRIMRETQNIEPIFIPLPSKETVYRFRLPNATYNNFLPRLTEELKARGVRTVNMLAIYEEYARTHDDLLYYPTDTHWNTTAMQLLLSELDKIMRAEGL